jgi:hypothetical protein
MLIDNRDLEIVDVLWNYYAAVRDRWPAAWMSREKGDMLNRTNGFRALMRLLGPAYLSITKMIGEVPSKGQFNEFFGKINMEDADFNIARFVPGTGGEAALFRAFMELSGLQN